MVLKDVINKSICGFTGYISSLDNLELLESYIIYNTPVIKEFKQVIISTNYKNYPELVEENTQLWKKYFPDCIILDSSINRGHNHGYCDLENILFDWCKKHNIGWFCKISNDVIIQEKILQKQIEEADFYYLNGIGYGGMIKYNFDFNQISNKDFYPQGNFYIMNISKCDFINNKSYLDETYNYIQSLPEYNGRIWEYIKGWSCEDFLKQCVERNNLIKYHLISKNYIKLLQLVKDYQIHDSSHKNIMIEGICHLQYPDKQVIEI